MHFFSYFRPEFEVEVYNISIMENLPNGFSVLHIEAKDIDQVNCIKLKFQGM